MRVAIIGASSNRDKYGNKALRSFRNSGHEVIPINPNEAEVEGEKAYASVAEVPGSIDRALLYVPASVGINVLEALAEKKVPEVFVNPGAESDELFSRAKELGLNTIFACAIMDIGDSPARY
jgi:predicted CoA-binding protein